MGDATFRSNRTQRMHIFARRRHSCATLRVRLLRVVTESALHNALMLRSDPLTLLTRYAARGERIARIEVPDRTELHLVNEPELVAQLLNDQSRSLRKFLPPGVGAVFANGILNSAGEVHATTRDAAQPIFHRAQIEAWETEIADLIASSIEELNSSIDREVNTHAVFQRMMLLLVGKLFFALDLREVAAGLAGCLDTMQRLFRQIDASPRAAEDFRAGSERFDRLLQESVNAQSDARRNGILFRQFDACGRIPERQLRDELRNFIMAGSLTTSLALAAACALLADHSDAQKAIRAETDGAATRAVFDETLRLYPPVWLMLRETIAPFALDGTTFAPATVFLISPWTLHRSPRSFVDPLQFSPSRWDDLPELPRGAFIPFSLGPRNCIGERLGRQVAELTLPKLLQRFALEPAVNHPGPEWLPRFTLWPSAGVWVMLREVTSAV
jgi:cytochrome P450